MVQIRVNGAPDNLSSVEAQYHYNCYDRFRKIPFDLSTSASCKPCFDESLKYVINHMKTNTCVTWTAAELHVMYTQQGGNLTRKQVLLHLSEYFRRRLL